MVVVGVGDNNPADIFVAWQKIRNIGDNIINSRHIFLRKLKSHVNNNDIILIFKNGHISTYFFTTTQRNYAKFPFLDDAWKNGSAYRGRIMGSFTNPLPMMS